MSKIVKLNAKTVFMRHCPGCGFLIYNTEAMQIKFNPKCPKGCDYRYSDFKPIFDRSRLEDGM